MDSDPLNDHPINWDIPDAHYVFIMISSEPKVLSDIKIKKQVEKTISSDLFYSYMYARDILKGRFFLGEHEIIKNPLIACNYARDVLKGRFPEAEVEIMKHKYSRDIYLGILKNIQNSYEEFDDF